MKKSAFALLAIILSIVALHSFKIYQASSITGKVVPPDGVESVLAVGPTDSVFANPQNGLFVLTIRPGTYKVYVDAKDPYRDLALDSVQVKEGENTDLGELRLVQ